MVDLIKLTNLLDEAKCYEVIRQLRWPDGVVCLHCSSTGVVRNGHDDRERHRQRYLCKTCKYRFDDLTGTVLAGHHQPVSTWILGSYFMGVNLSNRQIAHELGLCESDAQAMTEVLRHDIVAKAPEVTVHVPPARMQPIDSPMIFKGLAWRGGLPSDSVCDSLGTWNPKTNLT